MKFFLKYWKSTHTLEELRELRTEEELAAAKRERVELEIDSFKKGKDLEVVILEAASVDVLKHTHSRYFPDFDEIERERLERIR